MTDHTDTPAPTPVTTTDLVNMMIGSDTPETPQEAAEKPPTKAVAPIAVDPPREAVDDAQRRAAQAELERISRERAEIEQQRATILREREEAARAKADVERAQRLARLAKDDPEALVKELGSDPADFAKRLAERDKVSSAARAELEGTSREVSELKAQLAEMRSMIEQQRQQAEEAGRKSATAQLRDIAKERFAAAHHYLSSDDVSQDYIAQVADAVRKERGYVTHEAIAERIDRGMTEHVESLLRSEWAQGIARKILGMDAPKAPSAPRAPRAPSVTATTPPAPTRTKDLAEMTEEERKAHLISMLM